MPDTNPLYDIFIIYHPSDIRFVRRVDAHMKANGKVCWVSWDDLSASLDGQTVLKSGILRSHTVAIALSPKSAESSICNTLIQYAVTNNKRFVTLIVDENIEIDVHPAIAENPYIFFREQDTMEEGINQLLSLMEVDYHVELHTELLVYANDWDMRNRNAGLLLPLQRVDEAREWLAQGANREPKPSGLQVEFIHASRRQKSSKRWGISVYILMGFVILGLGVAVVNLFQSAQTSQQVADSRSTDVAIQVQTSDANAQLAEAVVGSATAEAVIVADFAQTATSALALANMAVDSASTADVMQQTAQADAQTAIQQASTALTAQAEVEAQLVIVSTESENAATLSAQVLTKEAEAESLIATAQSAQNTSLMLAQTATAVMVSAGEQANIAATDVANLATVVFEATQQLATATAVQSESDNNAGTAIAAVQIAATESNGRSTAEAELQALNDAATQTFQTVQQVNSQAILLNAEQALNAGDIDLAMTLGMIASDFVDDSAQVYRVLSRAADLSPSLILTDVARIEMNPTADEFAVIPRSFDRILIYDAVTHSIKFELTDHADDITTLRYSLDGRWLVSASQDGTIIIWSTSTGELIHQLGRHQGVVNAIAMHPDGQRMVTAGIRPMLVSWNLETGEEIDEYFAERGEELLPEKLRISADGSRVIGWSNPLGVSIMSQWSMESLNLLTVDSGGLVYVDTDAEQQLAWTGGRTLPAYANDPNVGDLIIWNMGTGQQVTRLTDGFNWSFLSGIQVAESTDSLLFMTIREGIGLLGVQSSDGGQRVLLVNLDDGTIQRTYQSNITAQITSADWMSDDTILSTTRDNRLVRWSLEDGALLREIGMSTYSLQNVMVSEDEQWGIVQASGGNMYLWSLTNEMPALALTITDAVTGTALNQAGDRILVINPTQVELRNVDTGQVMMTQASDGLATMNSSGSQFAVVVDDAVIVFDARTGIEQNRWSLSDVGISRLSLSPAGNTLLVVDDDGALSLLRADTDGAILLTPADVSSAFAVQFSVDGRLFVTLHAESAILWETATASELQRFPLGLSPELELANFVQTAFADNGDRLLFFVQLENNLAGLTDFDLTGNAVNRLTFVDVQQGKLTDDGAYLLIASTDNSVQIVNTATGQLQRRLVGHDNRVRDMVYHSENQVLFSVGDDNRLLMWDVSDGSIMRQYRHSADVLSMTVSDDSQRVLTWAGDGRYRLWIHENLSELVERIQTDFTLRELTCTEREQYNVLPLCE